MRPEQLPPWVDVVVSSKLGMPDKPAIRRPDRVEIWRDGQCLAKCKMPDELRAAMKGLT